MDLQLQKPMLDLGVCERAPRAEVPRCGRYAPRPDGWHKPCRDCRPRPPGVSAWVKATCEPAATNGRCLGLPDSLPNHSNHHIGSSAQVQITVSSLTVQHREEQSHLPRTLPAFASPARDLERLAAPPVTAREALALRGAPPETARHTTGEPHSTVDNTPGHTAGDATGHGHHWRSLPDLGPWDLGPLGRWGAGLTAAAKNERKGP